MKPRKTTFLLHRWVGLVISLQLLAWSVGGFVFSILDINGVRGDTDSRLVDSLPLSDEVIGSLPGAVRDALEGLDGVAQVALLDRGLGAHWEVRDAGGGLIARLGLDGEDAGLVTAEQAERIAVNDFVPQGENETDGRYEAGVKSVVLIEENEPMEYRGKVLPVYRVELEHEKQPHIYVDARTGRITSRRNRSWRTFDFFWMLHTMDYNGRDNFNHWLLTGASLLAILTACTGLTLWGWRAKTRVVRWRRRKALAAVVAETAVIE